MAGYIRWDERECRLISGQPAWPNLTGSTRQECPAIVTDVLIQFG